jgi:serine/threonine-protein kinase
MMSGKQMDVVERLLAAALERPSHERVPFLNEACGDDPLLRREVLELLEQHEKAVRFFDDLRGEIASSATFELESGLHTEIRIGAYLTQEAIGHGGMGAVFRAVRADGAFEQEVAIKVVPFDMETPEVRARFLAERQLLARLEHPYVARLLDGGFTAEGRPFFAMELVRGQPITEYCEVHSLSLEKRLRLFVRVTEAVSYLHQNLVVHRDLKPSNILVGEDGRPKILDFGIAKLLGGADERTGTALQWMTPGYAAPEQRTGAAITTATDVYALGVILYELLTGGRLHPPGAVPTGDVPEPPSRRLRSQAPGAKGSRAPLSWRRVAGDLDNICLKALQQEPERRYASADRLREDIERHLAGMPVLARGATWGYYLRKFAARHRGKIGVAAAMLALVVVAFVRERGLRQESESARAQAQQEAARATAVSEFLKEVFTSVHPDKAQGRRVTVEDVLEQAARRLDQGRALLAQPSVEAAVRLVLGSAYLGIARPREAKVHIERALALGRAADGEEHPNTVDALEALGFWHYMQQRFREAEALLRRVVELRRRIQGEEHVRTLTAMGHLASALWGQGRLAEVEPLDRTIVAARRRLLGEHHPDTLRALNGLGTTLWSLRRYAEAAERFEQALGAQRRTLGTNHPDTLRSMSNLSSAYVELGRYREAEGLARASLEARLRVLGEKQDDTAMSMHNLGVASAKLARYREAASLLERAIAIRARIPPARVRLLETKSELAGVYRAQKRYGEAAALYESTLGEQRRAKGARDPGAVHTAVGLARLRIDEGRLPDAERLLRQVLEAGGLGAEGTLLQAHIALAQLRNEQKRFGEALEVSRQAGDIGRRSLGRSHPSALAADWERQRALRGLGRVAQAGALAREIYEERVRLLGAEHPDTQAAATAVLDLRGGTGDRGTRVPVRPSPR